MEISKKQYISDLKIGAKAGSVFIVADKQIRKKKNGDDYCTIILQDREGSIDGVIWTEVYRNTVDFSKGDFVLVEGEVKGYKGGRQIIISSLKKIKCVKNIKYSDYVKSSKKNILSNTEKEVYGAARYKGNNNHRVWVLGQILCICFRKR